MFNLEQMQQLLALRNKLETEDRAKKAAELAEQRAQEAAKPKIKPVVKHPLVGKLAERFIADRVEVEGKQYVVLNLDADLGPWRATTPQQVSAYHGARYSGQFHVVTQGFRR